ncbi:unnamed protein product [Adineta steineri]|uniref:Uncharacterized protein n=1 Tax=Adineta steineri TaxID=433720 RepID=A0A814AUE6_9BILA|nr:unnamed protein product [Adineta steineri]CAF0982385.1 unnamed protein product [Adineta steineri]CAF1410322.1 unnamed protein product [Adineta steineri]CAF1617342.1 unnamed protein product [Adineta steineri]
MHLTSFTKYELKSANRSVVDFLRMLCANNIGKLIGTVVHTGILNEHGSYENDCSVIRLGEYHFLLVSPTSQLTRNMKWLKTHVSEDNSIFLSDVTSLYTVLNVIRPKAEYLLSELSDENFNAYARMACQIFYSTNSSNGTGEFCGFVTSAVYGFTLEKQVCLGFVHASSSEKININYIRDVTYEIHIATKRFKAPPNLYQSIEIDPTFSLYTNQFSNSISRQTSTNNQYVSIN